MPYRKVRLVNDCIYHIYNRGSEKRIIFKSNREKERYLKAIKYYQLSGPKPKLSSFLESPKLESSRQIKIVEILGYCLMPNHFHLLLKQNTEGAITEFMNKTTNSHTKYFNIKNDRIGPLFQGEFKAELIETDEQLIHVLRYIHLNPVVAGIVLTPEDYNWSSYKEYLENDSNEICSKKLVLGLFSSIEEFQEFTKDQTSYAIELELNKHLTIDE